LSQQPVGQVDALQQTDGVSNSPLAIGYVAFPSIFENCLLIPSTDTFAPTLPLTNASVDHVLGPGHAVIVASAPTWAESEGPPMP